MQHGSTAIGFVIIGIYLWINRDKVGRVYHININKKKICMTIVLVTLAFTVFSIITIIKIKGYIGLGSLVITPINSLFLSYLIIGFVLYMNDRMV